MKFTKALLITKLKATSVHLSLSAVVFFILAYQIYYNWYPQPYFSIDGGWQGMRIIAAVDLVLGPLITFLIFDLRKSRREIVFDLTIILVIQLGSLAYGIHAAYTQRPVAIIMYSDVVLPLTVPQYAGTLKSPEVLRQFSKEQPPVIYSKVPVEQEIAQMIEREVLEKESEVVNYALIRFYQPHAEFVLALRERQSVLLKKLLERGLEGEFDDWLQVNGETRDSVMVLRFFGRYGKAWLIFDEDGHYQDYLLEQPEAVTAE